MRELWTDQRIPFFVNFKCIGLPFLTDIDYENN